MFNSNDNGGENRTRQTVAVIIAVLVVANVVTGVTLATTGWYTVFNSDGSTNPDELVKSGSATYDSTSDRFIVSPAGSSSNGRWTYSQVSSDTVRLNQTVRITGGNVNIMVFGDDATSANTGYSVVFTEGKGTVKLVNESSGNTLKSASYSYGKDSYDSSILYDQGDVTVGIDGQTVLTYSISNPSASGSLVSYRGWTGSSGDNAVDNVKIEFPTEDTDGDSIYDHNDPYPNDAKTTYTFTSDSNETVDKAYLEVSNGSLDASLYGVNTTSGERIKLSETHADVGNETTLMTLDAVSGYDEYDLMVHGNATVESHGLLYEANSGGGVSSETFNDGISSVLGGLSTVFAGLRTGQIALGVLMSVIGVALWFREGGS
ncbi:MULTISPECIES: hypothetical protein [Halorussus]|uniref:Uncharacterized protein n=2 Tax=Halorussus TaxID=1070314 RepID=A0A8U0HVC5_9EURY|nr:MULTISPECIES: hypothetical protein [Halorussus]UPV74574.1 hypothetical protein M0R89_00550 [Halorussus limi]